MVGLSLYFSIPDLEIVCTDSCQSYDENKAYLYRRAMAESNPDVRGLLLKDRDMLTSMQAEMLFNILSYMSNALIGIGNTVAAVDELYLFLSNMTTIEYIRNSMKRVRKRDSIVALASQNIEDFLIPSIKEFTKPLFSIPTHQFLFYPGQINGKEYMDALQIDEAEYALINHSEQGVCLYRCGNERYLLKVVVPEHKAAIFGKAGGR